MRSVVSGRRYRWLLGALLVVAGIALHQSPIQAQDAGRPDSVVEAPVPAAPVVEAPTSFEERAVEVITNPVVAALLIATGVLLLLADLFTLRARRPGP